MAGSDAAGEDLVEVGRVLDAYGLKGQLKVAPHGGTDSVLPQMRRLWLRGLDGVAHGFSAIRCKWHSGTLLVTLPEIQTREQAQAWRSASVLIARIDFPAAAPDEFYWVDLIGCDVIDANDQALGRVADIDDHGAAPFMRVLRTPARGDDGAPVESLIPLVDDYLLSMDLGARVVKVDWNTDWD
ncbi:MAG: ribosome maturation factor RimM [Burkholderiaceae bacterium]